jgi:Mn2+/Fe2+ NRAMP family transporter
LNPIEITLGIMTAIGGFLDIAQIVFSAQAGSIFGYSLISAFIISTIAMIVFGEMSGRVAAIAKQPVFNLIRHRLGLKLGLVTLLASVISATITTAAEIGGTALILHDMTGASYVVMAVVSTLVIMASIWILPFKWIERTYGLLGLLMVVFAVALVAIHPPWARIAGGVMPQVPPGLSTRQTLTYSYFVIAIFSAVLLPYQVYFYSSGGIEEQWKCKDVFTNRVTIIVGNGLATVLSIALIALAAQLFSPALVAPQLPGSIALQTAIPFGKTGLLLGLLGILIAVAGSVVEVGMTNAYAIAQFFGWEWGRHKKPWEAPRFTLAWMLAMIVPLGIVMTGVDVMSLVEYAVLFSVIILPLTYFPLMLLAGDRSYMGEYANKWLAQSLGWFSFVVITMIAIAALPLYFLTSGGQA